MAPGGTLALTVVDETTLLSAGAASTQILPDMRELDGWVYSSEPLWVQVGDSALTVRRLRESVSPEGRMERDIHDEILYRVGPGDARARGGRGRAPPRRQAADQLRARTRPTPPSSCWRCRHERTPASSGCSRSTRSR